MKPKIIIIDGTSFIYRAFYAVKDLGTSHIDTNAIYGFVSMIKTLQKRYKTTPMICVFDTKGSNFRHEIYSDYKAHRPPPPDDLIVQIPYIHKVVNAFGIPIFSKEGIEADDIIGTLAAQYVQQYDGHYDNSRASMVHILTGDKDFAQIVSPNIHLYNSMTDELLDESAVVEKFGVRPDQIIDYLALIGDSVDNIPGVMKCGPVTARKWLTQYDNIDNMIANKDHLTGAVGENFRKAVDWLHVARKLVTINCEIDLSLINGLDINKMANNSPDHQSLYELFVELRFNRWLTELKKELSQAGVPLMTASNMNNIGSNNPAEQEQVEKEQETYSGIQEASVLFCNPQELIQHLQDVISSKIDSSINVIFETYNDFSSNTVILQLAYQTQDSKNIVANLRLVVQQQLIAKIEDQQDLFANLLEVAPISEYNQAQNVADLKISYQQLLEQLTIYLSSSAQKTTFNAKAIYYFFESYFQVKAKNIAGIKQLYDVSVLAYVLDSADKLNLLQMFNQYYDMSGSVATIVTDDSFVLESYFSGKGKYSKCDDIIQNKIIQLFALSTSLHKVLFAHFTAVEQKMYLEIELPLTKILVEMEQLGIKININDFKQMETEISTRLQVLEQNIYQAAGCVFNINSPKQLQDILYHKMWIPTTGIAKNDNGYSTDEQSLQLLQQQGVEIASVLLEYRYLAKILNTYVVALPKMIDVKERLHTTFEQTAVISGRLSSRNPNLQNIPVKYDYGKRIRDAFIVDSGYQLLKADYSQIELRLLAHFSQDKNLLQSFAEKKDIHTSTAMQVFNKADAESVSKDERRYAKTINFGIIYGQSAFSLAKELGITGGEAKEYIRRYFAQFPEVQTFIQTTHEQAIANGYVETLYGRKVYLKQINSKNHAVKQGQLRLAVNAILQGSAADIIKVAMIRIADYLNNGCDGGFDSAMLLQVHDELVFQLADAEVAIVTPVIQELMVKDFPLDLVVNI